MSGKNLILLDNRFKWFLFYGYLKIFKLIKFYDGNDEQNLMRHLFTQALIDLIGAALPLHCIQ